MERKDVVKEKSSWKKSKILAALLLTSTLFTLVTWHNSAHASRGDVILQVHVKAGDNPDQQLSNLKVALLRHLSPDENIETQNEHRNQLDEMQNKTHLEQKVNVSKNETDVRPTQRNSSSQIWQKFNDSEVELYVYSAFYDERNSGDGRVVRIIGVSQKLDDIFVYCVVSYTHPSCASVKTLVKHTDIGIGFGHDNKWFREYILICPMTNRTECMPTHVSLVTNKTMSHEDTLRMSVERAKKYMQTSPFGVCVASSYNHRDALQTVNWMEMQKILGASKVFLYNHSLDQETSELFRHYQDEGFVEIHQTQPFWDKDAEGQFNLHYSPSINDCYYRNMFRFNKIIVIDFDEMILPVFNFTYKELLDYIESTPEATKNVHLNRSYTFRNVYHFFELPVDPTQRKELIPLRHRAHVNVSGPGYSIKSILDPYACTNVHNHYCWRRAPVFEGTAGYNIDVDPKIAVLDHYKKCHFSKEECDKMMTRWSVHFDVHVLKYKTLLEQRVLEQVSKLNITIKTR